MKSKILSILLIIISTFTVLLTLSSITEKIEVNLFKKKEEKSISYYIASKGIYKSNTNEDNLIKYHGILIIPKINFKKGFFNKGNINNTVEKNIELLNESTEVDEKNSEIYIAGHSGTGIHSYFNNLDKLQLNDQASILYKGKEYIYELSEIKFFDKKETITMVKTKKSTLTLITCSQVKDDKYLVLIFDKK